MQSALELRNLSKSFGRVRALDDLSVSIPRGAVFGLLGPNGAGKSTTFAILCGWLRPSKGSSDVLGVPSSQLHTLRGRVAVLPQDAAFPHKLTVLQTLEYFGRLMGLSKSDAKREAVHRLNEVGLADAQGRLGSQLSHGMAKRAGLAQALMGSPDVLLLDEPTAGLDPNNSRRIKDLIASQAPRATVLVSSHNLAEIQQICTHGVILDHGKMTASGTISELTRRGAEITVEVDPNSPIPSQELESQFGITNIERPNPETLKIIFPSERDPAEVIAETMRILLAANTRVLGIHRGTSLESAFLELTN